MFLIKDIIEGKEFKVGDIIPESKITGKLREKLLKNGSIIKVPRKGNTKRSSPKPRVNSPKPRGKKTKKKTWLLTKNKKPNLLKRLFNFLGLFN